MNKVKKIISVLLCTLMVAGIMAPLASAGTCNCPNDPIVYVYGKHELYFKDDNGNYIYDDDGNPMNITDRPFDVAAIAKDITPKFVKAYFTGDYDAYAQDLLGYLLPLYDGIGVDGDGIPYDTTNIGNDDEVVLGSYAGQTHGYHMGWNNYFSYDYRLSPKDIAPQLNEYIEQVKANTGHDKVVLVARCQGCIIAMTWLQMYQENSDTPFDSVSKIVLLDGCMEGVDYVEAMLSGKINPSTESLYRLVSTEYNLKELIPGNLGELLSLVVDSLRETYGLDVAINMVRNLYDKIKDSVLSPFFQAFYGQCGTILGCVKDDFDDVIDYLYPTAELKEEYKGLIEKATYVNKNVSTRNTEILKKAEAAGVKVGLIGEYGFQSMPLTPSADYCADTMTLLEDQTLGATCSLITGTLDKKYIDSRVEAGLGKYISVDKQVDASTCAFPETTWIIKNAKHFFDEPIHVLIVRFVRDNITVSNQTQYPQFLNHNGQGNSAYLSPLQEKNPNDIDWNATLSDLEPGTTATGNILRKLVDFIKGLIETLLRVVKDITAMTKKETVFPVVTTTVAAD